MLKVTQFCLSRSHPYSVKALAKSPGKYKSSVFLPKTKFPQWIAHTKRSERDQHILKTCGFSDLYAWQRENVQGDEFVLHDGPPYANGVPHMGHAVNKILKDTITRWKLLNGQRIHYKPGWDCHGLPIELKALAGLWQLSQSPLDIRRKARKFAEETIKDQKSVFESWGIMADWATGCYHTFDPQYVNNQIDKFFQLYEKGLIYRDVKPVYWSPSSRTALAEAELEYNSEHVSASVTVALEIVKSSLPEGTHALIWTTTPWSIPANQAISYNPDLSYCVAQNQQGQFFLVGTDSIENLKKNLNSELTVVQNVEGSELSRFTYLHPLTHEELPFLPSNHVTGNTGTGLVHIAPAHGPDDFLVALKNGIQVECLVDEEGKYTGKTGEALEGLSVLAEGCDKVIEILRERVLHKEQFTHSYPYDWRTKKPVIIRASKQWFIDTNSIKERALAALKQVEVFPNRNVSGLMNQIEMRPYWCISRQRTWGVPIPVLFTNDDQPVINKELISRYKNLIEQHGTDFWWTVPVEESTSGLNLPKNLRKSEDILDIWLDSGLSWSAVLEGKTADLFVEGVDQFTGWFQSSLLTSVALLDKTPYK